VVSGPSPDLALGAASPEPPGDAPPAKSRRPAFFPEARGYVETPVYDRYLLRPGHALEGPAIVEERESTFVLGPGGRARVDATLTLIAESR
jgi:N-methylhydantoinase A